VYPAKVIRLVGRMQRDAAEVMRLLQADAASTAWDRREALLSVLGNAPGRRLPVREWRAMATTAPYRYDARGLGGFFRGGLVERVGDDVHLTDKGWGVMLGHVVDRGGVGRTEPTA
jgi:hypothetical protein